MTTPKRQRGAGAFGALIKQLRASPGDRDVDALEALARLMFNRGIPDEFARQTADTLALMVCWVYDFYLERTPGESKVRVFEPEADREGWELPYAMVAVATEDKPFLVDSTAMALTENGVTVHVVMHPQILAHRDKRGRLKQLLASDDSDVDKARSESLMLYWVERPVTDAQADGLTQAIHTALTDVDAAVSDYAPMKAKVDELVDELDTAAGPVPKQARAEARAFLEWLRDNHFTFLGYREYGAAELNGERVLKLEANTGLGVLRASRKQGRARSIQDLEERLRDFGRKPIPLIFTKTDARSTVHRRGHMDYIGVLRYDEDGHIVGECRFVGLYTSGAYHRSVWEIPFVRGKADRVLERSGLEPESHDGKALIHILESLPRDELFQSTVNELYDTTMGVLELEERNRTRVFVRRDHVAQFFSCLVFIPRERFNTTVRGRVQQILREALGGVREDFALQFGESGMVRVHFIVRPQGECTTNYDLAEIEQQITAAVRSWDDDLREALIDGYGEREGLAIAKRYEGTVPTSYKEEVSARYAVYDIDTIEGLAGPDDLGMRLYRPEDADEDILRFKVFKHDHTIPLSDAMPMLERMGLRTLTEWGPYEIRLHNGDRIWMQDLDLAPTFDHEFSPDAVREIFQDAFAKIWRGHAESDGFNRLILAARITWRQAALLRAYCKYLLQTGVPFSQAYMEDTLSRHPLVARLVVETFEGRLDPAREGQNKKTRKQAGEHLRKTLTALAGGEDSLPAPAQEALDAVIDARDKDRASHQAACAEALDALLDEVSSLDEDRILRAFGECVQATLRTNFYRPQAEGKPGDYFSFKFDPAKVPDLPRPRPFREIFVYSPRVEGVHLRGGMVARGGLRWSDRREDFRTEVLGLMKAQSVKNTMIVPVGAKGGFYPKQLPTGDRSAIQQEGIECYRIFIRGLLDITDNLVQGEVVHPSDVVRQDDPDPYLVVAADKGTATFSDYANELSKEYGFWLGDAFASGGSNGYDHKGMGITAKGAWESVKRHFRELGIDCQKEEHTAVGVGDMAGDVFGNGMLLSQHTRLIAAFNHLHIFIDPHPDTATAYKERQRLFKKVGGWGQYDASKISKGGGVWERSAKSIKLPEEARQALGIEAEELAPYEVIRAILRANVDLFWLGGIGTYFKASDEPDDAVGDRGNRLVRINANELGCRVVGEGANLGCTRAGRVEFALNGGYINSDFIDNSGGVDCSDHEVNIKILLNAAVDAGDLTEKGRSDQLSAMTEEVGALVLRNNYLQTQAISMMSAFRVSRHGTMAHFISWLEHRGVLERKLEELPDQEMLDERGAKEIGLTRPELAVLLSYAKIKLYPELLESNVPEDPYLAQELAHYFPTPLREQYAQYMNQHRVWREIIATQVTNDVINHMGATFVMRMEEDTSATPPEVARAYTIAREVFDAPSLWQQIEQLDNKVAADVQYDLLLRLWELLRHATRWILNRPGHSLDIAQQVERFRPGVQALIEHLEQSKVDTWRGDMDATIADLVGRGAPKRLAQHVAVIDALYPALDIVDVANQESRKVENVGWVYARLGQHFGLKWLRGQIERLPVDGMWHANARGSLRDQLYEHHRALTVRVLRSYPKHDPDGALDAWLAEHEVDTQRVHAMMADMQRLARLDYATAIVALRALEQMNVETSADATRPA